MSESKELLERLTASIEEGEQNNTRLQEVLEFAKSKLAEQDELLQQLMQPALTYATVVAMNGDPVKARKAPPTPEELRKPGTRVRIRRDSRWADQEYGPGTVRKDADHGTVYIDFDSGGHRDFWYRIGLPDVDGGTCDLELADETRSSQTSGNTTVVPPDIAFRVGTPVRIIRGDYSGREAVVGSEIDGDGDVQVRLDNGEEVGHYRVDNIRRGRLRITNGGNSNDPYAYKEGTPVEVVRGDLRGKTGTIYREVDGDGEVKVKWDDSGDVSGYIYIGRPLALEPLSKINTAVVAHEGKLFEVGYMDGLEIEPGHIVKLSTESMAIVAIAEVAAAGEIAIVRRVIDEYVSEVEHEGTVRVAFVGKFGDELEDGDRVVLDASMLVIVRNLGKDDSRFSFTKDTRVSWDDIGGLTEAKEQMIEAIELPYRQPEIYQYYGKKPVKGVLLYGPPGCGKTMLAKATATALADIHRGDGAGSALIYIKGPEILDRFVGNSEATIRQLFQRSRKHKEEHGYPAVIFIDEADAILRKRGTGVSSDIESTIVPMFLAEMDGLEDSGALLILATNRPDTLDPAVVRDGRIDRKIRIPRPDAMSAPDIFNLHLKGVPLKNGYSHAELAELGTSELFSDERMLYEVKRNGSEVLSVTLGHICNGGMIAGVVDQATSIAMRRDLASGKQQGLTPADISWAVQQVFCQNQDLNHTDELEEFVHDFRDEVTGIKKLRQAAA